MGLAQAKTIASRAMEATMARLTMLGAETPMKTSAAGKTSAREPWSLRGFVRAQSSFLMGLRSVRPGWMAPWCPRTSDRKSPRPGEAA